MKKIILFTLIVFSLNVAFSQASDFDEDYSKKPVCPGGLEFYRVADKYNDGRIIYWEVERGQIIGNYIGSEVTITWDNVEMSNGSMPKGKLTFYYFDDRGKEYRFPLSIPIISAKGVTIDVLIDGKTNPTVTIPYRQTKQLYGQVKQPQKYPNTTIDFITYEWTLSQGLTSPNSSSSTFTSSNVPVYINVGECTPDSKIQVRAVDYYCNSAPGAYREVKIVRTPYNAPAPTVPTISGNNVVWGSNAKVTFTTTSNPPADKYEWETSNKFADGTKITTTTVPSIQLTPIGCGAVVRVRAVYCENNKSAWVSSNAVTMKIPATITIDGPDPIRNSHALQYYELKGGNNLQGAKSVLYRGPCLINPSPINLKQTTNSTRGPVIGGVNPVRFFVSPSLEPSCVGVTRSYIDATVTYNGCTTSIRKNISIERQSNGQRSNVFNANNKQLLISYTPNPASNELTITFEELPTAENTIETYSVKLLNASGVVLRQVQFNHSNGSGKPQPVKFNISSLRKGTYFLHVEGGGELVREQIIVAK